MIPLWKSPIKLPVELPVEAAGAGHCGGLLRPLVPPVRPAATHRRLFWNVLIVLGMFNLSYRLGLMRAYTCRPMGPNPTSTGSSTGSLIGDFHKGIIWTYLFVFIIIKDK